MYHFVARLTKHIGVLFVIASLTACVSHVRSTVSTYQGDQKLTEGASFYIAPQESTPADFDELEFRYFADRLAAELVAQGYSVGSAEKSKYKMILQYDNTRQKRDSDSSRVHFHTSLGYVYRYGSIVVVDRNDYERYEFARRVKVSVEENSADADKVVSLSAISYGRCENLSSVFDEMVVAIIQSFDSPNGSVIPVKVSTRRPCSGQR